jgi:exodeoxyribonuclease I
MSFVFYDTETTGTSAFFDQILQFAAIRTDADLREIDRFEIRCRLSPHIVPSPGAMRVTRIRVPQLHDPVLPTHYQMIRAIRAKLLAWSPALFVGWNSIAYDENLLRQALYQTLHNPYLTNRDGNSRTDAMRIVQACSIFAPHALKYPTQYDDQNFFKLDAVAPLNGFPHNHAHDAVGDVEATIFLCRLMVEQAPEIWSSFMRFSTKAAVVDYINDEQVFCLSEFYFGRPFSYVVTAMGQNAQNSAEWYVYDLSVDPDSLRTLPDELLALRLNQTPKPLRRLRSNAAPMLASFDDTPQGVFALGLGAHELERRAAALHADDTFRRRLLQAFESLRKPFEASPHIEKQIYDGFFDARDEQLMESFHAVPWPHRREIVDRFQDQRLRTIGRQLLHLERPELLVPAVAREHDLVLAKRVLGQCQEAPWLTFPAAIQQIELLLAVASGAEREFLLEHRQFLCDRHDHYLQRMSA